MGRNKALSNALNKENMNYKSINMNIKTMCVGTLGLIGSLFALASCSESTEEFDATGTFEATEVTVSAENNGQLKSFRIVEGSLVKANEQLGEIETTQLALKKDELSSAASQIEDGKRQLAENRNAASDKILDLKKQLAVTQQQIDNARKERKRFAELYQDGAVAKKQVDDIDDQIKVLERQLAATEDQIASQNASIESQKRGIDAQISGMTHQQSGINSQKAQLDDQLAHAIIKSPLSGTVLEKYAEPGEYVVVGKPLFKVADVSQMFLRAYVTSQQLASVKIGQKVTVRSDYGDDKGKTYQGTVTWISSKSEFTPKTILTDDERANLVYAVKIAVRNDGNIKIGMYGKVKF